ncbi:hypothetical protein [Pseudomonas sp. PSE14]|uniref:hypothetical protein n=1 Tax=Pseudomonas TaxID=286 RepID=UPI0023D8C62A|nr:hypothetical protein [Pseudomonas sp. PSE14]WEJ74258.1 hypothetical protein O6P39_10420 [Pseudomonas sp. PSE14]
MKIGRFQSEEEFSVEVMKQAIGQRLSDRQKSEKGRPSVKFRKQSDMCLAYSISDDHFYIGYSAISGGIIGGKGARKKVYANFEDPDQPNRRFQRIRNFVGISEPLQVGVLNRPIINCAEACALSIAISWEQSGLNLVFVTFYPEAGDGASVGSKGEPVPKPPCENCQTWMKQSFGYWGEQGLVFRDPG